MDDKQTAALPSAPAVGISLNVVLGGGRTLVIQTHFDQDNFKEHGSASLDVFLHAADRQKAKYEIEEIENELRRMKLMQSDRERDLNSIKEGKELEMIRKEGDELATKFAQTGRSKAFEFPKPYIQRLAMAETAYKKNVQAAQIMFDRESNEIARLVHEIEKRQKIVAEG